MGWPFSGEAEARMRRHLASPSVGMRAPRIEDPARFGLEARREAERFGGYVSDALRQSADPLRPA